VTLRISAKDLGYLAMPEFCPRCFWIKTHCKLPYQIFPGIFSSIDSYSKKITWLHYRKEGKLPPWFCALGMAGEPIPIPSAREFQIVDEDTGVVLCGIPDDIFRDTDGIIIIDYKTARFTENADALIPIYRVQLNGYAYIAEQLGLGPVKKLWLVYYEPQTSITDESLVTNVDGFAMHFKAHCMELTLDTTMITPLLKKAKEIFEMEEISNSKEGCKDCVAIQKLNEVIIRTAIPPS
jgi:hypothetical protein